MANKANLIDSYTEMAPRYEQVVDSKLSHFGGWSYSGFINPLLTSAPVRQQETILDIFDRTGVIAALLEKAGHPRNQNHGLDTTMSMRLYARQRPGDPYHHAGKHLVCDSAMVVPCSNSSFTQAICSLATLQMEVKMSIKESVRGLKKGGKLIIADMGVSKVLKFPGMKFFVRIALFIYFILVENKSRKIVEEAA